MQEVLARQGLTNMGLRESFFDFRSNPFFGGACGGACVIAMAAFPTRRSVIATLALGVFAEMAIAGGIPRHIHGLGMGMGIGGAVALAAHAVSVKHRTRAVTTLATSLLLPMFILVSALFLEPTVKFHPNVIDPAVMRVEAALSPTFVFEAAAFIRGHAVFVTILNVVYIFLPLACAVVAAAEIVTTRSHTADTTRQRDVLTSFAIVGICGFLCYHLCPAIGPRPFFHGWPNPPDMSVMPMFDAPADKPEPRNCVPSLHTAWALVVYWHARDYGRIAHAVGLSFLALTLTATIGLGYHYVVDLCVAFPFTLAIRAMLATRAPLRARRTATAFGVALVATWLVIIMRLAPFVLYAPWLIWALAVTSFAGTVFLEARLGAVRPRTDEDKVGALQFVRDENEA